MFPVWTIESTFWLTPVFRFYLGPTFVKPVFSFWNHRMFQTHLVSSLPQPGIHLFRREPWFLVLETDVENDALGGRNAHCRCSAVSAAFKGPKVLNLNEGYKVKLSFVNLFLNTL